MAKKITFVFSLKTTFVQNDQRILDTLGYQRLSIASPPDRAVLPFIRNRIVEGVKSLVFVPRSAAVVVWFNDYHAFFPLLFAGIFGKKSILVVGGYDAVKDTSLNYGIFLKKGLRQTLARWNYRLAKQIWVVHKSLAIGCPTAKTHYQIQSGIRMFMPKLKTPIVEVPTAYDPEFWKCEQPKQPKSILTVANIGDQRTMERKGIPLFIRLAKRLPDYTFTIVGVTLNKGKLPKLPVNITLMGQQTPKALKDIYSRHTYYFQGSRIEGLPNVLCEAMLCECVPLGNAVFGIPDAIGTTGFVFNGVTDLDLLVTFLETPLNNQPKEARERIVHHYHQDRRIQQFKSALENN